MLVFVKRTMASRRRVRKRGTEVGHEPRFWYSYFRIAYGKRDPELDERVLEASFGVTDKEAHQWYREFAGWYDGVIDDSDGQVAEPGLLELPLVGGGVLVVEAHPGDIYVHRPSSGVTERDIIANFGPHSWIPEWSVDGAARQAGTDPLVFLVLAPLIRLTPGDDRAAAEARFAEAWVRAGILAPRAASKLAREWARRASGEE